MLTRLHALLLQLPAPLRFIGVGGAAAVVHFAVVWLTVEQFGLPPLAANVLGFLVAFCVSYTGHRFLSFARPVSSSYAPHRQTLPRFFTVACTSFLLNEALFYAALHWLHWPYLGALAVVLIIVALGTYGASKAWAFAHPQAREPQP